MPGKTTLLNHILANDGGIPRRRDRQRYRRRSTSTPALSPTAALPKPTTSSRSPTAASAVRFRTTLPTSCRASPIRATSITSSSRASGICEPIPIAYTISSFCDEARWAASPKLALDNIVAVVDCARMYDEFNGGRDLLAEDIDEDDIESLLIQQIEFCPR